MSEIKIITKDTFNAIVSSVNALVNLVRPTFGPAGNKVIISKLTHALIVDDGVQIARDYEHPDPVLNSIAKVIKEVAIKTNDRIGDGTTGALIMLQAIINEVAKKTRHDPRKIVEELRRGFEEARGSLALQALQISTKEELKKVAMISFDNEKVAEMIAETYFRLGKDAIITIDRSPTLDTTSELSSGIKIDRGYISPYMITNPERMETVFEKPYILITDYRLTSENDVMPIMKKLLDAKEKRPLVIIAENVEQNALATLVINLPHIMNPQTGKPGVFPTLAICAPAREDKAVLLEDIAIMTGATTFMASKGNKLEDIEIKDLGRAEKFICRRDESIIVEPGGKKDVIAAAIEQLKSAIESETQERQKNSLTLRLATFSNSLAVIKVGAPTDNEQKALKYKIEDAVNAVKAAYRGGVVCGGGLSLARIQTSSQILNEALKYPARQIWENMGIEEPAAIAPGHAVNVVTGETGPFMDVGVVDPVEVLIAGVESAVSIAGMLLTSSGMIIEHAKNTKEN